MYKKISIILIVISMVLIGIFVWYYFFKKDFEVTDFVSSRTYEVNSNYYEEIPNVCYGSLYKCQEVSFQKQGDVDITRVGEYNIIYYYEENGNKLTLVKNVKVVDTQNPVIVVSDKIKVCPNNGEIWYQKYEAYDNYDGDLTRNVVYVKEGEYNYLQVSDSNGNQAKVEVDVLVEDDVEPEFTLMGDSKVYLSVGAQYKELGFTAIDNCDGNLTNSVIVKNNIDYTKAGTYKLTYIVNDSSGNEKKVIREVVVPKIPEPEVVLPVDKTIYLTFDDGPCSYTGKLLTILDQYNVKATFFVTNQSSKYQYYIKEAYLRGHTIGIHSYSHDFNIYRSVDTYFNDLYKMSEIIKNQTGIESKIVRFPGGSSNTVSKRYNVGIMTRLANELEKRGYAYFDWNLDSGDTGGLTSSSQVANKVIKSLNNQTNMILMHDIKSYSVEAVNEIIQYGLSNGYTFAPIDINSPTFHHTIVN